MILPDFGYACPPPERCSNCGYLRTILYMDKSGLYYRHCLKCGLDSLSGNPHERR